MAKAVRGVMTKKVCWISAGISSFMAGYLAGDVDEWIYIDIDDQHPDSMRFIRDCEATVGKEIRILRSKEYKCVEDCVRVYGGFKDARNGFAPCTGWLKKRVRKEWEYENRNYDLTYVWGFDMQEKNRAEKIVEANPQAKHEFPLIDQICQKKRCTDCLNGLSASNVQPCMTWDIRTTTASDASRAAWVTGTGYGRISRKYLRAGRSWKEQLDIRC